MAASGGVGSPTRQVILNGGPLDEQDPVRPLLAALALLASRCSQPAAAAATTTHRRQRRGRPARRDADGRLRHPLSAVRAGQAAQLRRLRHRADEAIAEKIGREVEFEDTSFDTIFRDLAQGKFDVGRLGDDDHRRTREDRRLHRPLLPAPNRRSWSQEGTRHRLGRRPRRRRPSAPSRARPARNSPRKRPTPAKSAPTREGPDAIAALPRPARSTRSVIDTPVAGTPSKQRADIEISARRSRPKNEYGFAVAQGDDRAARRTSTRRSTGSDGRRHATRRSTRSASKHEPPKAICSATHDHPSELTDSESRTRCERGAARRPSCRWLACTTGTSGGDRCRTSSTSTSTSA